LANRRHKLAALRHLEESMAALAMQHQRRTHLGEDPAVVDREIAQLALTGVGAFFHECGIESRPVVRLLAELAALSAGSKPSRMLAPTVTRHRRPDPPLIEAVKGRLAAIMEFQQQSGLTRKDAGEWVARRISSGMRHRLGSATRAAVDSWLVKWGGKHGPRSSGREGYLHMVDILSALKPDEQNLKKLIAVLAKSLPS
jgi:hypothetical protein